MSAEGIPTPLSDTLLRASTVNRLLLASDYDGCIAPIVSRPQDAVGLPESIEALRAAARLDRTTVAVVSGRAATSPSNMPCWPAVR